MFCTRYGSANASSARGSSNFGPLTDLAISVFREVRINIVFTQIHTSRERRLQRWFTRRTGVWVSVFRNSVIHKIFSELLQPLRDFGTKRVSPFLIGVFVFIWFLVFGWLSQQLVFWDFRRARVSPFLPFNTFTWHSCGIGLYPTRVSPFLSSHSSAWHNWRRHGWWGRRTWGRRGMINFLPWRCHGCWRRQAWGRTCWQTKNHDRNEVLRVALFPNTVFNEMWFLTVDPLVWVSVFIAKLS